MATKKGFKHLTKEDRIKLEALLNAKHTVSFIAKQLNKCRQTIYNELKLGAYERLETNLTKTKSYSPEISHTKHKQNQTSKGARLKIGDDHLFANHIIKRIVKNKHSPAAVLSEIQNNDKLKEKFKTTICVKTLYNYIDKKVFNELTNKHLPVKKDKKRPYLKIKKAQTKNILKPRITERPPEVETRQTFGHWEMDTVIGIREGTNPCLLVLTERLTRFELIMKIADKTMKSVTNAINLINSKNPNYNEIFKTITMDNGSEMSDLDGIISNSETKAFYCHSYSSWERGSNENCNKLIRRHIPKGTDIRKYSEAYVRNVQTWINNCPRKIFGYKTAAQMFMQYAPLIVM